MKSMRNVGEAFRKFFANDRVKKIRNVILIGLIAYVIAFFVDQYYILGKKWWFILELI